MGKITGNPLSKQLQAAGFVSKRPDMDDVEETLQKLKSDPQINRTSFTGKFLNTIADIFEQDGVGTVKAFLIERSGRPQLRDQANALIRAVSILAENPKIVRQRSIGRLIIKSLPSLKRMEV